MTPFYNMCFRCINELQYGRVYEVGSITSPPWTLGTSKKTTNDYRLERFHQKVIVYIKAAVLRSMTDVESPTAF